MHGVVRLCISYSQKYIPHCELSNPHIPLARSPTHVRLCMLHSYQLGPELDAVGDGAETDAELRDAQQGIVNVVRALGFLEAHVREALQFVTTRDACLDWLCE